MFLKQINVKPLAAVNSEMRSYTGSSKRIDGERPTKMLGLRKKTLLDLRVTGGASRPGVFIGPLRAWIKILMCFDGGHLS
jgi:hypothetical protein